MMKILMTGATGLIGKPLVYKLLVEGHEIFALSRSPHKLPELPEENIISWTDDKIPELGLIKGGFDAVIHLAGEGIADKKWTKQRKTQLWNSRVNGTKNLITAISKLNPNDRPKLLISGSAIGYYPLSPDESNQADSQSKKTQSKNAFDENSPQGNGFLSELCQNWEKEANIANHLGLRTVILRTGLVLAKGGGVLKKTGPVVLGNGKQWMSWIHIQDIIEFILFALKNETLHGPFNLTSPNPVTNSEYTKQASSLMGFPLTLPAPSTVLALALGELSQAVLGSQKVLPKKTVQAGFEFKYPELKLALTDLLKDHSFIKNTFHSDLFVPLPRSQVFNFFSLAENLEILTPPWLNFHILKKSTEKVQTGTLIDYKLKIHGVPVKWKTLISDWNPDYSFVDNQLKGPYKKWHHLHTFTDVHGGTLISDHVTFENPGWIFGKLIDPLIKKDVTQIFNFRKNKIKELVAQGKL